jgi:hypothetical protein
VRVANCSIIQGRKDKEGGGSEAALDVSILSDKNVLKEVLKKY